MTFNQTFTGRHGSWLAIESIQTVTVRHGSQLEINIKVIQTVTFGYDSQFYLLILFRQWWQSQSITFSQPWEEGCRAKSSSQSCLRNFISSFANLCKLTGKVSPQNTATLINLTIFSKSEYFKIRTLATSRQLEAVLIKRKQSNFALE